jgi:hypothetical protein
VDDESVIVRPVVSEIENHSQVTCKPEASKVH